MTIPAAPAVRTGWKLDPAHTLAEFTAKHMMITNVRGHFTEVNGTVTIDRGHPDRTGAQVTITAASITTGVDDRDNHLRSADFLNVAKYPQVTFVSTAVNGSFAQPGDTFSLDGNLTIAGVTRPVTLAVEYEGEAKDLSGHARVAFSADTTIDRREFGLMWNKALETGGMLVGNDIRIHIEAQAIKAA